MNACLENATLELCRNIIAEKHITKDSIGKMLSQSREFIKLAHSNGASGKSVCAATSVSADFAVKTLWENFISRRRKKDSTLEEKLCILALGGYGRRELSPNSDIDILFLYKDNVSEEIKKQVADSIMYPLWDFGLKLGHKSTTPAEAIDQMSKDPTFKTSLLDMRILCGSEQLFYSFEKNFNSICQSTKVEHFASLMRLKCERHNAYNWTPYIQEPNIKNGIGGLRDFQTIRWKTRLNFGNADTIELLRRGIINVREYKRLRRAFDFLLRVRNDLHYTTSRATEILDLERQIIVAEHLGFNGSDEERIEALMFKVYDSFRVIDAVAKTTRKRMGIQLPKDVISAMHQIGSRVPRNKKFSIDGFSIYRGEITASRSGVFRRKPSRILKLFEYCQIYGCAPSDSLEVALADARDMIDDEFRANPDNCRTFLSVLQNRGSVFPALEVMHYWGVLGRFIPEFKEITCMVQREFYHRYTADIHTLNAISHLDKIFCAGKKDGIYWDYHKVITGMRSPLSAYLILFLHDIGKGDGIRGHADVGADIAQKILARFGLSEAEIETIVFVIRNHLEMARFWQRHDLEDEAEIKKFTKLVGDEETLKLLYVITFCDAMATSDGFWNSYKQGLHQTLFHEALERIRNESLGENFAEIKRKKIIKEFSEDENFVQDKASLEEHLMNMPQNYVVFHNKADIAMHMRLIEVLRKKKTAKPAVEWIDDPNRSMIRVCVVSHDRRGLYASITSALTVAGFDILGSKILTRTDGITIDTFYLAGISGGELYSQKVRERFIRKLNFVFEDIHSLDEELDGMFYSYKNRRGENVISSVKIKEHTGKIVLRIKAKDRAGLLSKITRVFFDCGYDIIFARANTDGGWVHDTFHLLKNKNACSLDTLKCSLEELK